MTTGTASANGLDLWSETFGDPDDPALLLIMGAGVQAIFWPTEFCEQLASRGLYVVRFDNRDVGLSTWLQDLPSTYEELEEAPAYGVEDMAQDTLGLMDALGLQRAHLFGGSLGGIIAEAAAAAAPERIASVTLFGLTPELPRDLLLVLWRQMSAMPAAPTDRDQMIAMLVAGARATAGDAYPFEEERIVALMTQMADRAPHNPAALARHAAAGFFSQRPGAKGLAASGVPTLIIHGTADMGYDLVQSYAQEHGSAEFLTLEGVGHELPSGVWPTVIDAIAAHTGV